LASGSLQAQPAPGDSEVSRGAWVCSAVTVATVAGARYKIAVAMCRSHGIGVRFHLLHHGKARPHLYQGGW
jgi:hypothetical protein